MRIILLLVILAWTALGQGTGASITGTISDPSGSAIVWATVRAVNLETDVARMTTTGSDGGYSLLFLPIGTYRVEVEAAGFKKFDQTGVVLAVNRNNPATGAATAATFGKIQTARPMRFVQLGLKLIF